jgi:hypothetical protein
MPMNFPRVALAGFCALVACFVVGELLFTLLPLQAEFMKYPAVYRSQDAIKSVMPAGMVAMFVAMVVLTVQASSRVRGSGY